MGNQGWASPPAKSYISGDEEYLRDRELRRALQGASLRGREVMWTDPNGIQEAMTDATMFEKGMLLIVEDPENLDPEMVRAHRDDKVSLVLYHKGALGKKPDVRAVVPNMYRFNYDKPKSYKMLESRVAFVLAESQRYGMDWPKPLAEALVHAIGEDLGVLSFEVQKACIYRKVLGGTAITADIIKASMWMMGAVSLKPLIEALGSTNEVSVLRALSRIRGNSPGTGAAAVALPAVWVGNTATQWLHSCALEEMGAPAEECATRLGVPEVVYTLEIAPRARKWGAKASKNLIRRMGAVRRSMMSSHIDPWIEFEVALVQSCREAAGGFSIPFVA